MNTPKMDQKFTVITEGDGCNHHCLTGQKFRNTYEIAAAIGAALKLARPNVSSGKRNKL